MRAKAFRWNSSCGFGFVPGSQEREQRSWWVLEFSLFWQKPMKQPKGSVELPYILPPAPLHPLVSSRLSLAGPTHPSTEPWFGFAGPKHPSKELWFGLADPNISPKSSGLALQVQNTSPKSFGFWVRSWWHSVLQSEAIFTPKTLLIPSSFSPNFPQRDHPELPPPAQPSFLPNPDCSRQWVFWESC